MARDFSTIGVIGLGTMGAGIAEVFARNGFSVVGVEQNDEGVERGREHLEHSTGRAVKRGKITEADAGHPARPDLLHHRAQGPRRRRPRRRGGRGVARGQEGHLPAPRRGRDARDAILATNTSSLSVTEISHRQRPPRPRDRRPLLQPGAGPEAGRDHPHRRDRAERARRRGGPARGRRQEPGHLRRQGGLHRQHAALRLPQPRRVDVRAPLRLPRGHRRRDAVRLRLPDGPAGAARPDRARHGVRDPRHDVQAGPRPAARARPDPQAVRHRRPARPQVRPRLLHLRGARQPGRRARRPHPVGVRRARSCGATCDRVGVVGTGTMATGIVEVFAKGGYDVLFVGRSQAKVDGVRAAVTRSLDKQIQRGRATEDDKAAALGRLTGTTSLDDLADVDLVVEAIAEDLAVKTTLFENLDEICKPGAILATTTSCLPVISLAGATSRPQDVIGMHFFNPAAVMKLVEVVSTVATSRRGGRDDAGPVRRGRQGRGLVRRPGRLHRQRAAVPLPQRRGQDARGPLRHGRRHRHRDEAGLRAADGPVRAARRGRQRRRRWRSSASSTWSSASRASRPRRCSSTSSPRATSAARPAAASATTAPLTRASALVGHHRRQPGPGADVELAVDVRRGGRRRCAGRGTAPRRSAGW